MRRARREEKLTRKERKLNRIHSFRQIFIKVKSISRVPLCHPMVWSLPGSSIHGISRQEYWSGLPFPSPGDLPNPGIGSGSLALQADSLASNLPGTPYKNEVRSGGFFVQWLPPMFIEYPVNVSTALGTITEKKPPNLPYSYRTHLLLLSRQTSKGMVSWGDIR